MRALHPPGRPSLGGRAAAQKSGGEKGEKRMNKYQWLDEYLRGQKGCAKDYKAEWGWWRYRVGGKMFAAVCQPGPEHGIYGGRELVTLKCEPMLGELLRAEYPDILPGFYADKRCWISVFLAGEVPDELLRDLCGSSYQLVFKGLTKKLQREIEAGLQAPGSI